MAATIEADFIGNYMRKIATVPPQKMSPVFRYALHILPYIFVRASELASAKWEDVDFSAAQWRYTVSKTNTPHIVPLAPQVIKLLQELHTYTGDTPFLFPQCNKMRSIQGKYLIATLRRLGYTGEQMTIHGFRAVARTMLDEVLGERYDLIEQQLAHCVRDPNGRAYNRTVHLPERTRMMERWANYLDELRDKAE